MSRTAVHMAVCCLKTLGGGGLVSKEGGSGVERRLEVHSLLDLERGQGSYLGGKGSESLALAVLKEHKCWHGSSLVPPSRCLL